MIRNMHIPVNRLPPEILSKILEHRRCEKDLVTATHVCRYWRSTLTSSPPLWTRFRFLSIRDVDRTLAYLERSKSATVDIKIYTNHSQDPGSLQLFAPHISRTRSFAIQGSHGVHAASSLLLCSPAPFLEYLEMRAYGGPVGDLHNFLGRQAPSLRSAIFQGIFPVLESPFPLPNLTEFTLIVLEEAGAIRISSLFHFLSNCPQLRKISIDISCEMLQDVSSGLVISLEALEELDYICDTVCRVLPFLKLPCLSRLRVSSRLQAGQVGKLADILPHDGRHLLSGVTRMLYSSTDCAQTVGFFREEAEVSITGLRAGANFTPIDWFSDGTCIPLGQIQDLRVDGDYIATDFSFDLLKNLTTLRAASWDSLLTNGFLRLLYPGTGTVIVCPSLHEIHIRCNSWVDPESVAESLLNLVREREGAGHRLGLVNLLVVRKPSQGLEDQLREHVGELRFGLFGETT